MDKARAGMTVTSHTALDVILSELDPIAGKCVLDVGCGPGAFCHKLEAVGVRWCGIDPFPGGNVAADVGYAEDMPYESGRFNAAICVNALHHVSVSAMPEALREIARVLRFDGILVVIEPKPDGALSRVLASVDDETEIRKAAQAAMDDTTAFDEIRAYEYDRVARYVDFNMFCACIGSVSVERAKLVVAQRDRLAMAFEAIAGTDTAGDRTLEQPMSVRVLRPRR